MARKKRSRPPEEKPVAAKFEIVEVIEEPAPEPEQATPKNQRVPVKKEQSAWWVKTRAELPGTLKAALARIGRWGKENFGMEPRRALGILLNGLIFRNPVLVLALGLCAVLAASVTLYGAVGMGLTLTAVLTCSNLAVSLLRKVIPQKARGVCHVAVIAVFATLADVWLRAVLPALSDRLGIFVPLLAVNGLLLARAERFASEHTPGYALVDGLSMGLGYTIVLTALGGVREILSTGGIGGVSLLGAGYLPVLLAGLPCGGFILLGLLTAGAQWLRTREGKKGGDAA